MPNTSPSPRDSFFKGVAALSANDAWAVGSDTSVDGWSRALVEHWDGTGWTVVPAPTPGLAGVLTGVTALAPDDAWAVGYYFEPTASGVGFVTLIEHWDGSAWTVADAPQVKGRYFNDVTAAAPDNVWAVGPGVAEHWDGTRWTPGDASQSMTTIIAPGATDLWGAGPGYLGYWDGSAWNSVAAAFPGDGQLESLAAVGQSDVWGVGNYAHWVRDNRQPSRTLAMHWDGGAWTVVTTPNGGTGSELYGVSAISSGDVWAVGHSDAGSLVEHWDGKRWRVIPATGPAGDQTLSDAASTSDGAVFAVGYDTDSNGGYHAYAQRVCEVQIGDSGFASAAVGTGPGKQMFWNVARDASTAHGIRDSSGLRMFNSGLMSPGSSYGYAFKVAGTYTVTESPGGTRGTVGVSLSVSALGANAFVVGWGTPNAGFVVDAQVQRPGSAGFSDWVTGSTASRAGFMTDAGPGAYTFRARLRNVTTGAASGWSPVASGSAG